MVPLRDGAPGGARVSRDSLVGRLFVRQSSGTTNPGHGTTAAIIVSFGPARPSWGAVGQSGNLRASRSAP